MKNLAIITGTTRGLGRALVGAFNAVGWSVAELNRPTFDLATLDDATARAAVSVSGVHERVVFVNNAAAVKIGHATAEETRTMVATNVAGPVTAIAAFLAANPKGEVANITSSTAHSPMPHWGLYSATKAAMETYLQSLEVAGIRCWNLDPGAVDTEMQQYVSRSIAPISVALRSPEAVAKNLVWRITRG